MIEFNVLVMIASFSTSEEEVLCVCEDEKGRDGTLSPSNTVPPNPVPAPPFEDLLKIDKEDDTKLFI